MDIGVYNFDPRIRCLNTMEVDSIARYALLIHHNAVLQPGLFVTSDAVEIFPKLPYFLTPLFLSL